MSWPRIGVSLAAKRWRRKSRSPLISTLRFSSLSPGLVGGRSSGSQAHAEPVQSQTRRGGARLDESPGRARAELGAERPDMVRDSATDVGTSSEERRHFRGCGRGGAFRLQVQSLGVSVADRSADRPVVRARATNWSSSSQRSLALHAPRRPSGCRAGDGLLRLLTSAAPCRERPGNERGHAGHGIDGRVGRHGLGRLRSSR